MDMPPANAIPVGSWDLPHGLSLDSPSSDPVTLNTARYNWNAPQSRDQSQILFNLLQDLRHQGYLWLKTLPPPGNRIQIYVLDTTNLKLDHEPAMKALELVLLHLNVDPDAFMDPSSQSRRTLFQDDWSKNLYDIYMDIPSPYSAKDPIKANSMENTESNEGSLLALEALEPGCLPGMRTELYPYQKHSVWKMMTRERCPNFLYDPSVVSALDMDKRPYFLSIKPAGVAGVYRQMTSRFDDTRGGILCEEMGSGKTIICIALILLTKDHFSVPPLGISRHCVVNNQLYEWDILRESFIKADAKVPSLFDQALVTARMHGLPYRQWEHSLGINAEKLDNVHVYYYPTINNARSGRLRGKLDRKEKKKVYLSRTTLVVVPDNLMDQWALEIYKHTESDKNALSFLTIPNGHQVIPEPLELMKYDLVLIAQNRLSTEHKRTKPTKGAICNECSVLYRKHCPHVSWVDSPLRRIHWQRVIVDEGHSMASKWTDCALLVEDLFVSYRWLCTGTPTPNLAQLEVTEQARVTDQDIDRLSNMFASFFKIGPFDSDLLTLRNAVVAHAKISGQRLSSISHGGSSLQSSSTSLVVLSAIARLGRLLDRVMVRNRRQDLRKDIELPPLYERVVELDLDRIQAMTLNCQIAQIQANAVLSQREDEDYFFHERNTKHLAQAIKNLNACCFWYPGGDDFKDSLEQTLGHVQEAQYRQQQPDCLDRYSDEDLQLLMEIRDHVQNALSDPAWLKIQHKKEVAYYCRDIPLDLQTKVLVPAYKHGLSASNRVCIASGDDIRALRKSVAIATSQPDPLIDQLHPLSKDKENTDEMSEDVRVQLSKAVVESSTSTKLNYIVEQVLKYHGQEKSIVFCQTDDAVYYIREYLELAKIRCLVYHGKMSLRERSSAITTFMSSENAAVLIMNIDIAAYGINLPTASRVYFVSPVWEAAKRQQAIKRAHRIGQTRPVYVETLVVRDSFEHWILDRSVARENEKNLGRGGTDAVGGRAHRALASDKVMHELFKTLKFFHPMSRTRGSSHQEIDLHSLEIPVIYPTRQPNAQNRRVIEEEEKHDVNTDADDVLMGEQSHGRSEGSPPQRPSKVRFASLEVSDTDMEGIMESSGSRSREVVDMGMRVDIDQDEEYDDWSDGEGDREIILEDEPQMMSDASAPEKHIALTEENENDLPSPVPEVMDISSESEPCHLVSPSAVLDGGQRREASKDLENGHGLKRIRFE
ncbi:hypothetical protein EMPS_01839 [Entomortierella parvispora]|uniref:Helicase C-terminal domain-containing protein n=1 Tax=Entomortierella parvispora TaxID=205924 RepID=A0A9P3H4B7_9FUNG|nr:hypothetical protein EMPS_01839 [Entomortierella parvispora]